MIQKKKHQKFGKTDFGNQYEALKTKNNFTNLIFTLS